MTRTDQQAFLVARAWSIDRLLYSYKIDVYIDGSGLWETVYWDISGTSTWYSQAARDSLGEENLDLKYDEDQAAWDLQHQTPPDGGGGGG